MPTWPQSQKVNGALNKVLVSFSVILRHSGVSLHYENQQSRPYSQLSCRGRGR